MQTDKFLSLIQKQRDLRQQKQDFVQFLESIQSQPKGTPVKVFTKYGHQQQQRKFKRINRLKSSRPVDRIYQSFEKPQQPPNLVALAHKKSFTTDLSYVLERPQSTMMPAAPAQRDLSLGQDLSMQLYYTKINNASVRKRMLSIAKAKTDSELGHYETFSYPVQNLIKDSLENKKQTQRVKNDIAHTKYQDYVLDDITGKIKEKVIEKLEQIQNDRKNDIVKHIVNKKHKPFQRIYPEQLNVNTYLKSGEFQHKSVIVKKCIKPVLEKHKRKSPQKNTPMKDMAIAKEEILSRETFNPKSSSQTRKSAKFATLNITSDKELNYQ